MDQEHYLKYAVYMTSQDNHLVKVEGGYFASTAWMKGDDEYEAVLGRKFGGLFGDDGKSACCDRGNIRRLKSDEEFNQLLTKAHPAFKMNLKLEKFLNHAVNLGIIDKRLAGQIWYRESKYMNHWIQELPGVKISEIVRHSIKVLSN